MLFFFWYIRIVNILLLLFWLFNINRFSFNCNISLLYYNLLFRFSLRWLSRYFLRLFFYWLFNFFLYFRFLFRNWLFNFFLYFRLFFRWLWLYFLLNFWLLFYRFNFFLNNYWFWRLNNYWFWHFKLIIKENGSNTFFILSI